MTKHVRRMSFRVSAVLVVAIASTTLTGVANSPAVAAGRDIVVTLDKAPTTSESVLYGAPALSTSTRAITVDVASVTDLSAFSRWEFYLADGTTAHQPAGGVRNGIATISTPAGMLVESSWTTLDILGRSANDTAYLNVRLHFEVVDTTTGPTTVDWRVNTLEVFTRGKDTVWSYGDFQRDPLLVSPGDTVTFVGTPGLFTTGPTGQMTGVRHTGYFSGPTGNIETLTSPSADGSRLTIVIPSPPWWEEAGESRTLSGSASGRSEGVFESVAVSHAIVYHRTLPAPEIDRVGGADRFAVANTIATRSYPDGASVVVIANGVNYPDALSGSAAAAFLNGPLLLTRTNDLPAGVGATIERLGASRIVVVGGTSAVSDATVDELASIPGVTTIERVPGADRFETSRALAWATFGSAGSRDAYLATGLSFPDALSASALAGTVDAPVILIDGRGSTLDAETTALLDDLGVERITIVGGPNAISTRIESSLRTSGQFSQVERLAGNDRYETSSNIARAGFAQADRVFIATGVTFPDALAGSAWAAASNAPLIVVPGWCIPRRVVTDLTNYQISTVTILGGTNAVSTSVGALTVCPGFDWPNPPR